MGRAFIVNNLGSGLYQIRLDYDTAAIERELADLQAAQAGYQAMLEAAVGAVNRAEAALRAVNDAVNAVIEQWAAGLIGPDEASADPPPVEAPGGSTDEGDIGDAFWTALNDLRTAATMDQLDRIEDLDGAARDAAGAIAYGSGRLRIGADALVSNRAYAYDAAAGVEIATIYGATDAATAAVRAFGGRFAGSAVTDGGAVYVRALRSPWVHLWIAICATPGDAETTSVENPSDDAADDAESGLAGIEQPDDNVTPKRLADAVAALGKAGAAARAAREGRDRIMLESATRLARIDRLESLIEGPVIHAWACEPVLDLEPGDLVATAEVPGWYDREPVSATTSAGGGTIEYLERDINVTGYVGGQLRHADALNDPLIAHHVALEPGWAKWRPNWRHGIVTALRTAGPTYFADVDLNPTTCRTFDRLGAALDINQSSAVTDAQCIVGCPEMLEVGDEVLVLFLDWDWGRPAVIGWRREPPACEGGLFGWGEILG